METIDYTKMTDEELARLAQSGNDEGSEALLRRYKNLVIKCARPYFIIGQEQSDLIQEGMIGLYKAVLTFRIGETKFITYAYLCIKSTIIDAIKLASRAKHRALNNYTSLHHDDGKEDDRIMLVEDSPEVIAERLDSDNELIASILGRLSKQETEVYRAYMSGLKLSEITAELNISYKAVDNTLQRIRKKIRDIIKRGEELDK